MVGTILCLRCRKKQINVETIMDNVSMINIPIEKDDLYGRIQFYRSYIINRY